MNEPVNDAAAVSLTEVSWEIYEIGEPAPYAWSWRCRSQDQIVRRSSLMYTNINAAIEDAVKHGMKEPAADLRRC